MSTVPLSAQRSPRHHAAAGLSAIACVAFTVEALGQDSPTPSTVLATSLEPKTNSLAMQMVPVEGTTVLFATTEATVDQFQQFVTKASHQWSEAPHFEQGGDHPVVGVSLDDARAFCTWLTGEERRAGLITEKQRYRLPTTDEWSVAVGMRVQSAVRSGDLDRTLANERLFPWGEAWPPPNSAGNYQAKEISGFDDGYAYTAPVGSFAANAHGLHDLGGNAWEWCEPNDKVGPTAILRGGAWVYFRQDILRATYEYEVPRELRASTFGFRTVFEDVDVSRRLITEARAGRSAAVAARSTDLLGPDELDESGVSDARNRFLPGGGGGGGRNDGQLVINDEVKPPTPGQAFVNTLGMDFVPFGEDRVLMSAYETRVREFELFIAQSRTGWPERPTFNHQPHHCASGLNWNQAAAFCAWLTKYEQEKGILPANVRYRLPSDVEWSTAVGLPGEVGGSPEERHLSDTGLYPWGTAWPPPARAGNFDASRISDFRDRYSYTGPVGQSVATNSGIHDLAGNVSEWVSDRWGQDERVLRGTSWLDADQENFVSAFRRHAADAEARTDLGFRCVLVFE